MQMWCVNFLSPFAIYFLLATLDLDLRWPRRFPWSNFVSSCSIALHSISWAPDPPPWPLILCISYWLRLLNREFRPSARRFPGPILRHKVGRTGCIVDMSRRSIRCLPSGRNIWPPPCFLYRFDVKKLLIWPLINPLNLILNVICFEIKGWRHTPSYSEWPIRWDKSLLIFLAGKFEMDYHDWLGNKFRDYCW
jgi:hypothetical protein